LGWVELEVVWQWPRHRPTRLQRCDPLSDFVLGQSVGRIYTVRFGGNRPSDYRGSGNSSRGIPLPSRSRSHEIVDRAFRNLKLAFLREDGRNIPARQLSAVQLVN
jgi:hypothetical protein